jgi:hypothetical protein
MKTEARRFEMGGELVKKHRDYGLVMPVPTDFVGCRCLGGTPDFVERQTILPAELLVTAEQREDRPDVVDLTLEVIDVWGRKPPLLLLVGGCLHSYLEEAGMRHVAAGLLRVPSECLRPKRANLCLVGAHLPGGAAGPGYLRA